MHERTNAARLLVGLLLPLLTVAMICSSWAGEDPGKGLREIRHREIYVPYKEFLKVVGKKKNAAIMTLEEYRTLVSLATARSLMDKKPDLPPIQHSLAEVIYEGTVRESVARFDATFKLMVAGKKWVRCDLGPVPAGLGRITLDDGPGWVVRQGKRAYLLVKGAGLHKGTLSFSAPVSKEEDALRISTLLLQSATSVMRLGVAGRAKVTRAPMLVDTEYDKEKDHTTFSLALRGMGALDFSWKGMYGAEQNKALLLARQQIGYFLRRASPGFTWQAKVTIGRRKTTQLEFVEPPGGRVVRLSGPQVHSWERAEGVLRIFLNRPTIGDVSIHASGIVPTGPGASELGCPQLRNAYRDARYLALFEAPDGRLEVEKADGYREISLSETVFAGRRRAATPGRLARLLIQEKAGAKITVRLHPVMLIFDTQAAVRLHLEEKRAGLDATFAVHPERGRLYRTRLKVPTSWTLESIHERGTGRGLRAEKIGNGDGEIWDLTLDKGADAKHPLRLLARLRFTDTSWSEEDWQTKDLRLATPFVEKARRTKTHLGVSVHPSIDAVFVTGDTWETEPAATLQGLGIHKRFLRAGMVTDVPGDAVQIKLTRKQSRGAYDLVTHLLTLEQLVWLRSDIRLSVVDRAVEELLIRLPTDAPKTDEPLRVTGQEIKEVAPGPEPDQRLIRFNRPWLGARLLRVEYRIPLNPEDPMPVPNIEVLGAFDGRKRIIFQSAGAVKLEVSPGPALALASLEETPAFAKPFQSGRSLFSYTFHAGGDGVGTYSATVYERTDVLNGVIRKLNLTTRLDPSGRSRTYASFLLTYSREQYLSVRLPEDARWLAASVDGQRVLPVEAKTAGVRNIPLPPHTNAQVELVYERARGDLGRFGSWSEDGPELLMEKTPVGATEWRIIHPTQYKVETAGGNMAPTSGLDESYFAITFWGRIFSGRWPRWTAWERDVPSNEVRLAVAGEQKQQARPQQQRKGKYIQALQSKEAAKAQREKVAEGSIAEMVIPEGASYQTTKLGGEPRQVIFYRELDWSRFAKRTLFLLAAVVWLVLAIKVSRRAAIHYLIWGLVLGTVVPSALMWTSPLLWVPFCEGLTLALIGALAAFLWSLLRRGTRRVPGRTSVAAMLIVVVALPASGSAMAGENEPVLIPYPPKEIKKPDAHPKTTKVYVPRSVFADLMSKAFPEKKPGAEIDVPFPVILQRRKQIACPPPPPQPVAFGNAYYELTISEKTYQARGNVDVRTFGKKQWSKLALQTGPSQLVGVKVDDKPASVLVEGGVAYLPLHGEATHKVQLELTGPLQLSPGQAELNGRFIGGAATRLMLTLPKDMKLDVKTLPAGAWIEKTTKEEDAQTQQCEIQLGANRDVRLRWHSEKITGKIASRIASNSFTTLSMDTDGYGVHRHDRIKINGTGVDRLVYRVLGGLQTASVASPELSEWVIGEEGGEPRLTLVFNKPLTAATIDIRGWAILERGAPKQVAAITLLGAIRQEGFFELRHGGGRKFSAASLKGLKRSARGELAASFRTLARPETHRFYRFLEPPTNQQIEAEFPKGRVTLKTDIVGVVEPERLVVSARTRYVVTGPSPLRHEIPLPNNWTVRNVQSAAMRTWAIEGDAGAKRLVVYLKNRAVSNTEVIWSAEQPLKRPDAGEWRLDLPQPRLAAKQDGVSGADQERVEWVLAADRSLELSQVTEGLAEEYRSMRPVPVARASKWVRLDETDSYRFAFQSSKPESKLAISITPRASITSATVVGFIRPAEDHIHVNTRCRFRIDQAGVDRFRLRLPVGARLIDIKAENLRSWQTEQDAGGAIVTVRLLSPVVGEQTVDLAHRITRRPGQDAVLGPVQLVDKTLQRVEHYVGIVRIEQRLVTITNKSGLEKLPDVEKLPYLPAGISKTAITQAFVADRRWSLTLSQPQIEVDTGEAAEIAFAIIKTVIAADGRMRSVATYRVRNRSRQFLQIEMPEKAALWGVLVDGKPGAVSHDASSGKDVLLIPIQRMGLTDPAIEVNLIYEHERIELPAGLRTVTPSAPRVVNTPVVETYWQVYVPENYGVTKTGGNVKDVAGSRLLGSKLSSDTDDLERIMKFADQAGTKRMKYKALRNASRLQQSLSDGITEMEETEGAYQREAQQRVDQADLKVQMAENTRIQSRAVDWNKKVIARQKEIEKALLEGAGDEDAQAYRDAYNFLGNRWRGGQRFKKRARKQVQPTRGQTTLKTLLNVQPFGGFGKGELAVPAQPMIDQKPKPIAPGAGMREESDELALLDAPAAQLRLPTSGRDYTYRRVEGHPELTITLRSKESTWFLTARVALAVILIGAWLVWRKRNKSDQPA